jgi:hypothetical protein
MGTCNPANGKRQQGKSDRQGAKLQMAAHGLRIQSKTCLLNPVGFLDRRR